MSNKHDRPLHHVHRPRRKSDVVFGCVERVLRSNAIIALRLQRPHYFGKARAVSPKTMTEHYARLARTAHRRSHFRLRRRKGRARRGGTDRCRTCRKKSTPFDASFRTHTITPVKEIQG